jgi:hypothetical protein
MKTVMLIKNGVCWCMAKFKDEKEFEAYKERNKNNKSEDIYWDMFFKKIQSLKWNDLKLNHIL